MAVTFRIHHDLQLETWHCPSCEQRFTRDMAYPPEPWLGAVHRHAAGHFTAEELAALLLKKVNS